MADNQGSARVTLKEIDLSQVRDQEQLPQGVPAAVVGTSKRGPAFVPHTFATIQQFNEKFGSLQEVSKESNANRFGPLALNEWMRNAQAGTFLRVLGAGSGDGTLSNGRTAGAGFVVGDSNTYDANNKIAKNEHATITNANLVGATKAGRTHFLGCFMKDTTDSTFLQDAGIETEATAAATATITITGEVNVGGTITIIDSAGKSVNYTSAVLEDLNSNEFINTDANAAATSLASAINHANGHAGTIVAAADAGVITLTQSTLGSAGNTVITENADNLTANSFSGGTGGEAAPVIRGLLMTPQGVVPSLSLNTTTYSAYSGETTELSDLNKNVASAANVINFGNTPASDLIGYELGKVDSNGFVVFLNGFSNTVQPNVLSCSFDPESVNYFAKVLNTDPAKLEECGHYLHAHWDIAPAVAEVSMTGIFKAGGAAADTGLAAFCLHSEGERATEVANSPDFESFDTRFRTAVSPWIMSQKFGGVAKKLFRVHALDDGAAGNDRYRVLVSDLRSGKTASDWSTFTLSLEAFDSDPVSGEAIVSWKNLTLDPDSRNFIGRVIGNKNTFYSFSKKKLVEDGEFEIRNNFIRVELTEEVMVGDLDVSTLPCGFKGYKTLNTEYTDLFNESGTDGAGAGRLLTDNVLDGLTVLPLPLVKTITRLSGANPEVSDALAWGVKFAKKKKAGLHGELSEIRLNPSIASWTKFLPDMGDYPFAVDSAEEFSLENISLATASPANWSTSIYERNGTASAGQTLIDIDDHASGLSVKYLKFRCLMQGGFDGLNIFNKEKAEMSSIAAYREAADEKETSAFTGATVESLKKAIDVLSDKSATEFQLLAIPGIREPLVTDYAITACETRFDAMLVLDIEEIAVVEPITDNDAKPHVQRTINRFDGRQLDTSFAAAYFPDVISRRSSNNTPIQVPPSVCMLGVMSQNDTLADPWFAPAGLTRGRLNASSAKIQMSRDLLNNLYDADINPIYIPAGRSGEVYAFGQKTLLQNQSALDRINVRRLLINIRRKVKAVANTLLFEPNRASTLERFSALVEPIMAEVQARQGVERYKVQIDTSTTTQNDVENNTIRGKVYLQPTKSVEFISLDFVVTNSID